jgi:low affinity Fe/Cu permease
MFRKISTQVSNFTGHAMAFMIALSTIIIWLVTGPAFNYSDTWQLAINTGTTIITFLMVFLIQNTQNRDSRAMHLKLDELIKSSKANNKFINLDDLSDKQLDQLEARFKSLQK